MTPKPWPESVRIAWTSGVFRGLPTVPLCWKELVLSVAQREIFQLCKNVTRRCWYCAFRQRAVWKSVFWRHLHRRGALLTDQSQVCATQLQAAGAAALHTSVADHFSRCASLAVIRSLSKAHLCLRLDTSLVAGHSLLCVLSNAGTCADQYLNLCGRRVL